VLLSTSVVLMNAVPTIQRVAGVYRLCVATLEKFVARIFVALEQRLVAMARTVVKKRNSVATEHVA